MSEPTERARHLLQLLDNRLLPNDANAAVTVGELRELRFTIEAEARPRVTHHAIGSSESCDFCRLYRDTVAATPPTDT